MCKPVILGQAQPNMTWAGCKSPRDKSWLVAQLKAHMKFKCVVPCPCLMCQTSRGLNSLVKLQHYNQTSHRAATRPHHCSLRTFLRWLNELGGRNPAPGVASLTLISVTLCLFIWGDDEFTWPNFHCTSLTPKLKEKTTIWVGSSSKYTWTSCKQNYLRMEISFLNTAGL